MRSDKYIFWAISTAVYLLLLILLWDYSIDDAFITFRYAEHFANGHGLVFNIGDQPIEGYSNFLWLLLLAGLYQLGLPTYLTAKIVGIASFSLTACMISGYFRRRQDNILRLSGPIFLLAPVTAFWAVSGLELGLHTLLLIAALLTLLRRSRWIYILLPLLVFSRPEGVAVGLLMLFIAAVSDLVNKKLQIEYYFWGCLITVLSIAALVSFRMSVFGHPLPNTFYAKTHHESIIYGFIELGRMLALFAPLSLTVIWAVARIIGTKFADKELSVFTALFLFQAVVSSSVDPVMNFHFRYMIPFLPLLIIIALKAVSTLIKRPSRQWAAVILFVISLLLPLKKVYAHVQQERDIWAAQKKFIAWAAPLPAETTISMTDMGRIPYYADKIYHDLWGLTNDDIGRDGFDPKREFSRLPDYFVFVGYLDGTRIILRFGRERLIGYKKSFHNVYKFVTACHPEGKNPETPGYYYLVFVLKPDIPLPELKSILEIDN